MKSRTVCFISGIVAIILLTSCEADEVGRWAARLKDKEPNNRAEAANQLGKLHKVKAVEPLIEALKDSEWNVRWEAAISLQEIAGIYRTRLVTKDTPQNEFIFCASEGLMKIGDPAFKPLLKALQDEDVTIRLIAALALQRFSDRAIKPLINALKDRSPKVREFAVDSLTGLSNKKVVVPLIRLLKDSDSNVSQAAIRGLSSLKDYFGPETFKALLQNADEETRKQAMEAIDLYERRK